MDVGPSLKVLAARSTSAPGSLASGEEVDGCCWAWTRIAAAKKTITGSNPCPLRLALMSLVSFRFEGSDRHRDRAEFAFPRAWKARSRAPERERKKRKKSETEKNERKKKRKREKF
jgi:hypothetical protein